jgi:hypothetical protein
VGVVVVDVAVARSGHGVDGALALLEAGRRHFGSVCRGRFIVSTGSSDGGRYIQP